MADIFDEVDEILDEIDSTPEPGEETVSANNSFDESELHEIMSEIENLEKEFDTDRSSDISSTPMMSSEYADGEVEEISEEISKESTYDDSAHFTDEEIESMSEIETNVIPMSRPVAVKAPEISFEAQGQMTLNLGFKIGEEVAQLSIDPIKGLCVKMNGVELIISDQDGCQVTMESGVKFTIPLTSEVSAHKKKSA